MIKKKYIAVFCIVSVIASFAYAKNINEAARAEEVILYIGEIRTFSANVPRRIAIGKPDIADVTEATNSEITVAAKSVGTTTFVYWDNFGEQDFSIRVLSEDVHSVKQRADRLIKELNLPKVYTKAADAEEKVLLLGEVKTAQDRERIFTALGSLKDKVVDLIKIKEEEAVVDIEVQILELNRDATNTLGFSWPSSITLTDTSGPTTTAVTGLDRVFHVSDFKRTAFNVTLDALIQEGKARILSRPRLACQSGKEAELLVGGEKPILNTQVVGVGVTGTGVEYKEYGIKLKIKPTVFEDKRIKLALHIEVSEVEAPVTIGGTNTTALAYPLKKRNASTELFLNDGQTMAIGGLIKQKSEEDIRKTPWLGDIPVLGMFFRKKQTMIGGGTGERGNVELFITLTPTIVSKEMPTARVAPVVEKVTLPKMVTLQKIEAKPNVADYVRLVQAKIVKAVYYPQQAKDAGWEGIVKMNLNISSNGQLKEVKIAQSSGYKILDDAAQEIVSKQAPYPPFPPQIDSQELWVEVPIIYKKD